MLEKLLADFEEALEEGMSVFDTNSWKRHILWQLLYDNSQGKEELVFQPYFEKYDRNREMKIDAHYMNAETWEVFNKFYLEVQGTDKEADEKDYLFMTVSVNDEPTHFLSKEQLDLLSIPFCNPKIEVSSTETISRNNYDSNTDTYGSVFGTRAVSLDFLYLPEMNKYVVVQGKYLCL